MAGNIQSDSADVNTMNTNQQNRYRNTGTKPKSGGNYGSRPNLPQIMKDRCFRCAQKNSHLARDCPYYNETSSIECQRCHGYHKPPCRGVFGNVAQYQIDAEEEPSQYLPIEDKSSNE